MRSYQFLTILLLAASIGACASQPAENPQASSAQAEIHRAYMYTLDKRAREGFTQIQWIHPPTDAQAAQRVKSEPDTD